MSSEYKNKDCQALEMIVVANVAVSRATVGGVGEKITKLPPRWARMCGGWDGGNRRVENFVAVCAAAGTRTATGLAVVRRIEGSDLPLRRECESPLQLL
jgi:hypothetical protein